MRKTIFKKCFILLSLILLAGLFGNISTVFAVGEVCIKKTDLTAQQCPTVNCSGSTAFGQGTCEAVRNGDAALVCCEWRVPAAGEQTSNTTPTAEPAKTDAKQKVIPLTNPLGGTEEDKTGITDPTVIVARVVTAALGLVGSAALVMFLYGGFMWLTSVGNEDKVKDGLKAMLYAVIGLAVVFSSYVLLKGFVDLLTKS